MGESWFQREFLNPRRLVFNVIFYGIQSALFALGWYLQVSPVHLLNLTLPHRSS
jgi:NADPH oxidase 1